MDDGQIQLRPELLRHLSDEAARVADILESMGGVAAYGDNPHTPVSSALVRTIIQARRLRERYLPGKLFADPAWDILLDLTAARLEKRQVCVTSLCIAASVPPTTALRWIALLSDRGLVTRMPDAKDGRRTVVELTDEAADAMIAFLGAAHGITPLAM